MSKTVLFQTIQFSISTKFSSIWLIEPYQVLPHSPKLLHYWSLTIRLFSIISWKFIVWFLPLCRETVGVFYCPSLLGNNCRWRAFQRPWKRLKDLKIRVEIETIHTTALLRSARILGLVLETRWDMLPLELELMLVSKSPEELNNNNYNNKKLERWLEELKIRGRIETAMLR